MKRKAWLALAVLSLCGTLTAPLGAQSRREMLTVNIPFEFTVSGKAMPAGEYVVAFPLSGLLRISQSAGGHQSVSVLGYLKDMSASGDNGELTFHRLLLPKQSHKTRQSSISPVPGNYPPSNGTGRY